MHKVILRFQTGKLGAGCFGQIYLVKDKLLSRFEALKVESASKGDRAQLPMELQVLKKYQGKLAIRNFFAPFFLKLLF